MVDIELNIKSLKHSLSSQMILGGINLHVEKPQAITLLGPNGAGKSTLLKAISAQFYCQSGEIVFNSKNSEKHRSAYLAEVGYMPELPIIFSELTVIEQLSLMAHSKNVKSKEAINTVIQICKLEGVLNKRTIHLSLGYKQRLNLAQAIINKPPLLIMDEPLNGLDPHLIVEFRSIINRLKKSSLILISTHYLAEAETISDRIIVMKQGMVLDDIEMKSMPPDFDLEKHYMKLTLKELC